MHKLFISRTTPHNPSSHKILYLTKHHTATLLEVASGAGGEVAWDVVEGETLVRVGWIITHAVPHHILLKTRVLAGLTWGSIRVQR